MTDQMSDMVQAFIYITEGPEAEYDAMRERSVRAGLTAALDVAPTVEGWVWCAKHKDMHHGSCVHLGPWVSDVEPCPSCSDNQLPPGVSCYTCAGSGSIDKGTWGDCPGPHQQLVIKQRKELA